jgi:hypothetical protein
MVAVGEIEDKVLSKFQSRVHSHLQGFKNRKNPFEDTNFSFQNDPQDVGLA